MTLRDLCEMLHNYDPSPGDTWPRVIQFLAGLDAAALTELGCDPRQLPLLDQAVPVVVQLAATLWRAEAPCPIAAALPGRGLTLVWSRPDGRWLRVQVNSPWALRVQSGPWNGEADLEMFLTLEDLRV